MCRGHGPCCDPSHGAVVDYVCLFSFFIRLWWEISRAKNSIPFYNKLNSSNWIGFTLFHICAFCRLFLVHLKEIRARSWTFCKFPNSVAVTTVWLKTARDWNLFCFVFFSFCLTFKFIYWLWSHSLRILAAVAVWPSFKRTRKHPLLHIVETALGSISRLRLNHKKSEI